MPRSAKTANKPRHDPLHVQLAHDVNPPQALRPKTRVRQRASQVLTPEDESGDLLEGTLDAQSSRTILQLAMAQQTELEHTDNLESKPSLASAFQILQDGEEESTSDEDVPAHSTLLVGLEECEVELDENDVRDLERFRPADASSRKNLADIIIAKMGQSTSRTSVGKHPDPTSNLHPDVVTAYTRIGQAMRGRGPLIKLFKILPTLPNWAQILALTQPENWSPYSCRRATKVFVSNMKPPQAQIFLRHVLLPAVQEDIAANGKLNIHYYEALIASLYKPSAFFKGIIFPLTDEGCTLKEAAIVGSVIAKKAIPPAHLGAAIMKMIKGDFSGPRVLVLRVLLDKKKALPYKVLDEVVSYFVRECNAFKTARDLAHMQGPPVLWHQALLCFTQRYSINLAQEQKDTLLDVVRIHVHPLIGPEIRRELLVNLNRENQNPSDGDNAMA